MIQIRKHSFPSHYKIPENPSDESIYALIRPKRDLPPPLYKSKFATHVRKEKQLVADIAKDLTRKGKSFHSIQISPMVNNASILSGTPYHVESHVSTTAKASPTGLYSTLPKKKYGNTRSNIKTRQAQSGTRSPRKTLSKPATPPHIVSAIPKAAEPEYVTRQDQVDQVVNRFDQLDIEEEIQEEIQVEKEPTQPENKTTILAAFKSNWEVLNAEFQRLPITKKLGRRTYLEKQLQMIEENIKTISRSPI